MWKLDEDHEITKEVAAIVDWQLIHEGSPMTDLAILLVHSTDGDVRRYAEEFIVELYHELLEKEMKEAGKACPYTVAQLKEAYNYMFLTQVYGFIMFGATCDKYFEADTPGLKDAKLDKIILRTKHLLEDMDKLLTGPMKHVLEKYG